MVSKIKNFQYYGLVAIVFFIFGIFCNSQFIVPKINHTSYEMTFVEQKDKKTIKIDSITILKLENAIAQVEKKNDGRFEVLTWSSTLILAILGILLAINFFVSEAKVKEIIDKKHEDIISNIEKQKSELNTLIEDIENIRTSIETMQNNQVK
jgi:NADH:ubiquinone oxidoreductase subunit 5 (subunit L)/multisubunit Na+/H+ antiporter MnhA subunit